jgi:hypothetical protein
LTALDGPQDEPGGHWERSMQKNMGRPPGTLYASVGQ